MANRDPWQQHMPNTTLTPNATLSKFLRPVNTTVISPMTLTADGRSPVMLRRPRTTAFGSPYLEPLSRSSSQPFGTPQDPFGRPTVGCRLDTLPWSMAYWGRHNVFTQPGSYNESVSTTPYAKFTRAYSPPLNKQRLKPLSPVF